MRFLKECQRQNIQEEVQWWEIFAGSASLTTEAYDKSMWTVFAIDLRYQWDLDKQEHLDLIDMRPEVPIVSLIPQPDFTNERKVAKFLKVIHSFSYMGKPKFCLVRA